MQNTILNLKEKWKNYKLKNNNNQNYKFYIKKKNYYSNKLRQIKEENLNLKNEIIDLKLNSENNKQIYDLNNCNNMDWVNKTEQLLIEINKKVDIYNKIKYEKLDNNRYEYFHKINKIESNINTKLQNFLINNVTQRNIEIKEDSTIIDLKNTNNISNFINILDPLDNIFNKLIDKIDNLKNENLQLKLNFNNDNKLNEINEYILLKKENLLLNEKLLNSELDYDKLRKQEKNSYNKKLIDIFNILIVIIYENNKIKHDMQFKFNHQIPDFDYKNFNPENLNDKEYEIFNKIKNNYSLQFLNENEENSDINLNLSTTNNYSSENKLINTIESNINNTINYNDLINKDKEIHYLKDLKSKTEENLLLLNKKLNEKDDTIKKSEIKIDKLKKIIDEYNINLANSIKDIPQIPNNLQIKPVVLNNNFKTDFKIDNFNLNISQNNYNFNNNYNIKESSLEKFQTNCMDFHNKDLNFLLNFPFKNLIITYLFNENNKFKNENAALKLDNSNFLDESNKQINNIKTNYELEINQINDALQKEKNENSELLFKNLDDQNIINSLKLEINDLNNNLKGNQVKSNFLSKIKFLILKLKKTLNTKLIKNQIKSLNILGQISKINIYNTGNDSNDSNILQEISKIKVNIEDEIVNCKKLLKDSEINKFKMFFDNEINEIKQFFVSQNMDKFIEIKNENSLLKDKISTLNNEKHGFFGKISEFKKNFNQLLNDFDCKNSSVMEKNNHLVNKIIEVLKNVDINNFRKELDYEKIYGILIKVKDLVDN